MLKRIITAVVCLTIFAPVLIFSGTPVGKIVFISLLAVDRKSVGRERVS